MKVKSNVAFWLKPNIGASKGEPSSFVVMGLKTNEGLIVEAEVELTEEQARSVAAGLIRLCDHMRRKP